MTQQKIKELLTKTFGEEEANDPDVVRLYTDCLRQAVEEVTNEQSLLDNRDAAMTSLETKLSVLEAKVFMYEQIISKSNFAPMLVADKNYANNE